MATDGFGVSTDRSRLLDLVCTLCGLKWGGMVVKTGVLVGYGWIQVSTDGSGSLELVRTLCSGYVAADGPVGWILIAMDGVGVSTDRSGSLDLVRTLCSLKWGGVVVRMGALDGF